MRVRSLNLLLILLLVFLVCRIASGATFNVTNPTEFQNALTIAQSNGEDDVINVAAGTYNITSTLTYYPSDTENYSLTIQGQGADCTVIDGGGKVGIMSIDTSHITDDSSNIKIKKITFRNGCGSGTDVRGGIYIRTNSASITLEENIFLNNSTEWIEGAGAYLNTSNGIVTVSKNTFTSNSNNNHNGGGIYIYSNLVTLTNNTFTDNSAAGSGGGAYISSGDGTAILTNNTFNGNSGDTGGGVLISSGYGTVTLTNNTFTNNDGGGAYVERPENAVISNNTFTNNSGHLSPGGIGIIASYGMVTLADNTFTGNSTDNSNGGGAAVSLNYNGTVAISNNTFSNNSASNNGGGLVSSASGTINLTNNTFVSNSANIGGGAWIFSYSKIVLNNNRFTDNSADNGGGGAYTGSFTTEIALTNNVFSSNSSNYNDGGGILVESESGVVTLTNNTFTDNSAAGSGGGVYMKLNYSNIYNNIFWNNTAGSSGNDGDDLFMVSSLGPVASVNLYNNDFSGNADFTSAQSEDLYICVSDTNNYHHASNIQQDPLFVDEANGDFHLQVGSPCIDAGANNAAELPETDFEGDPRTLGSAPDMGADEYKGGGVSIPIPDIKVNGSDGPITVRQLDSLSITLSLDNNGQTDNADWWLAADTPFGLFFFTFDGWTDAWVPGYQGPLFYLDSFEVLNMPVSGLPAGTYTLYFGVDTVMDGNVTWDSVYYDTVVVNVIE